MSSNYSSSMMFLASYSCVLFSSFWWMRALISYSAYFFRCTSSVFARIASFFSFSSSMFRTMLPFSSCPAVDLNYWYAWFLSTDTIFLSTFVYFLAGGAFYGYSSNSSRGMLMRLEMLRVGLASFTAFPAPNPKLCSSCPTLLADAFFSPPSCFFSS